MTVTRNRAKPVGSVDLTIAQLAEQAAESIRALNHLTYPGTGASMRGFASPDSDVTA